MENIKYDSWISEQIGCDAYSLTVDQELMDASIDSHAEEYKWFNRFKNEKCFVFSKIDPLNVEQIKFVENHGFNLIDTNVIFKKEISELCLNGLKEDDYQVCFANKEDETETVKVARSNFVFSRFHLDPFFNKELADKIKAGWVRNFFYDKRGDKMVVAKINGKVAGFMQLFIKLDHIIIDLIAVDHKHRNNKIAQRMIEFAIKSIKETQHIIVGTQLVNLPSINLYQKLGFKLIKGKYVFHYHN